MLPEKMQLKEVFHSSGSGLRNFAEDDYECLRYCLRMGYIVPERITIDPDKSPTVAKLAALTAEQAELLNLTETRVAIPELLHIRCRGKGEHDYLSFVAAAWLIDQSLAPISERENIDITSNCKTWAIELGDTNPRNIVARLYEGYNNSAIMPFQEIAKSEPVSIEVLEMASFKRGDKWDQEDVKRKLFMTDEQYILDDF